MAEIGHVGPTIWDERKAQKIKYHGRKRFKFVEESHNFYGHLWKFFTFVVKERLKNIEII